MSGPGPPATDRGTITALRRPAAIWALVGLLAFVGLGAVGGAVAFLADTTGGAAGLDPDVLRRTPFTTYFWPSVLLATLLAAPSFILVHGLLRRPTWPTLALIERATGRHWSWAGTVALGTGLMTWIATQVLLIEPSLLQPLMFVVGAVIVALALTPATRRDLTRRVPPP